MIYEPPNPETPADRRERLLEALRRGHTIGGISRRELAELIGELLAAT